MEGFSERIVLPDIPQGPGVCIIEDEAGNVLQIAESINIRRRIGELMDSEGKICVHGPKIHAAQRRGERIYIRWKLTTNFKTEKKRLIELLRPKWIK
jgi:excinuclease UvrABC nuclease subunit